MRDNKNHNFSQDLKFEGSATGHKQQLTVILAFSTGLQDGVLNKPQTEVFVRCIVSCTYSRTVYICKIIKEKPFLQEQKSQVSFGCKINAWSTIPSLIEKIR